MHAIRKIYGCHLKANQLADYDYFRERFMDKK
jgi:hypothetical protein